MTTPSGPAGVFDRAAGSYDAVDVPFFGPIAEGLVAELRPVAGERVLDLGCGRGAVLIPMARLVGPGGCAVGIDLAPEMIRRTAADLNHLRQVKVKVDDGQHPSLPPRSFDVVASSLVLFLLPRPGDALARWTELLVPGGRLGVTTFGDDDPMWHEVEAVFLPFLPAELRTASMSGTAEPWDSDEGMEALLRDSGLVDVRTMRRTVRLHFHNVDHLLAFTWSHGQRAWWEAIAEKDRSEVVAAIAARVAELELDRTGIAFDQHVRYSLGRWRG